MPEKPRWSKPAITEIPEPPQTVKDAFAAQLALCGAALPAPGEIDRATTLDRETDDPGE